MKIMLKSTDEETRHRSVEIFYSGDDLTIATIIEQLVKPALFAFGYNESMVEKYLGEIDPNGYEQDEDTKD